MAEAARPLDIRSHSRILTNASIHPVTIAYDGLAQEIQPGESFQVDGDAGAAIAEEFRHRGIVVYSPAEETEEAARKRGMLEARATAARALQQAHNYVAEAVAARRPLDPREDQREHFSEMVRAYDKALGIQTIGLDAPVAAVAGGVPAPDAEARILEKVDARIASLLGTVQDLLKPIVEAAQKQKK